MVDRSLAERATRCMLLALPSVVRKCSLKALGAAASASIRRSVDRGRESAASLAPPRHRWTVPPAIPPSPSRLICSTLSSRMPSAFTTCTEK
jgi:hypothetical protein